MKNDLLEFECSGIDEQGNFITKYTGYGEDISPEFIIKNLSPDVKTIAITLEDLDHPIKNFTHWVVWNIPAKEIIKEAIALDKDIKTVKQGIAYGLHRYAGPKPPKRKSHSYKFTLYTLDCEMNLSVNIFKKTFLKKIEGHTLQKGEIIGRFIIE